MFYRFVSASLLSVSVAAIAGCADPNAVQDSNSTSANVGYISLNKSSIDPSTVSPIRQQALTDTATALGAQGALAWRSERIDNTLNTQTAYLDKVFDFNQLLIHGNVQPPVLSQADNTLTADGTSAIRLSDKTYRILTPSKFVTTPLNWRNYLWMSYSKPTTPDKSILPKNDTESQIWNTALKTGWQQGLQQANAIFSTNLNRLKRDFNGMVLYRKLLANGMVTAPYVAKASLGVTGDANEIRINDKVLRIAANSRLIPNASQWNPVITGAQ